MDEQVKIDLGIEEIVDQAHAAAKAKEERLIFFKKISNAKTILSNKDYTKDQFDWATSMLLKCADGVSFLMAFFMADSDTWPYDGRFFASVYSAAIKAGEEGVAFLKFESSRLSDKLKAVMMEENPHRNRELDYDVVQFVNLCEITGNVEGLVRMLTLFKGVVHSLPPAIWQKYQNQIWQAERANTPVGSNRPFQKATQTAGQLPVQELPVPNTDKAPKPHVQKGGEGRLKVGGKEGRESRPRGEEVFKENFGPKVDPEGWNHVDNGKPNGNHAFSKLAKIAIVASQDLVN